MIDLMIFTESKEKVNKKPKVEKKEPESPKMPKIPLMDPKSVRANAKKALFQTLWKRYITPVVHKYTCKNVHVVKSVVCGHNIWDA